jgi:hypothetical protein
MTARLRRRRHAKAAGLVFLFGYFLLFCAFLLSLEAMWRTYRTYAVEPRWIETPAELQNCSLGVFHPFVRDGGGSAFSLRCRLDYQFASRRYAYDLHTISDRSQQVSTRIRGWITQNGPGTTLLVRVNPSDPNELVVTTELPIHQFLTAKAGWLAVLVIGAPGLLLLFIGRPLAAPRY